MTLPIVPPALFNAQVLAADDSDPHVQPGNHIRINAHPLLGLPVAPFFISRVVVPNDKGVKFRDNALYIDSNHRILTPPFELRADNPVTVFIPLLPGESCIWARVLADPMPGGFPPAGGRSRPRPAAEAVTTRARLRAARLDRGPRIAAMGDTANPSIGMIAEGFASSPHGPASVGRRSAPPYAFSAPGIVEIRLMGTASVNGTIWIEAKDLPLFDFLTWTVVSLPHLGGPRYLSIDGAIARAALRVLDQAPKRRPLQETIGEVAPVAAPTATPAYEALRVNSLVAALEPDLNSLITDLSDSPLTQIVESPLLDADGEEIGIADQRRLDRLFQAQLDPGSAALLGYKARDRDFTTIEDTLVFYWITGFFRDFPTEFQLDPAFDSLIAQLAPANRIGSAQKLTSEVRRLLEGLDGVQLNKDTAGAIENVNDYIGLGTLCVADRSAPLLLPAPPRIDRASHIGWLPVTPPAAKREVELELGGVLTGGLLAAETLTPATGERASLNSVNAAGTHLSLVLGLNVEQSAIAPAPEPGTGFLFDREAAPEPIRYAVAQQDRFGRWSEWASVVNDPGPRPRPPRPVIRATYKQPANPASEGGTVRIQVDVPPLESLAPGSFPIAELRLSGTYAPFGGAVQHVRAVPNPLAPIDFTFAGPILAPTSKRKLRLTAVWRDTNGTDSVASEPQTLTMHDPRPPGQLPAPPDELLYSGRPDVTGLAMVEHEWAPLGGQANFAVYYTDENRLRAHLEATGQLALLNGATDAAARATVYRANAALFGAHLFERLQGVVFEGAGASGTKIFRHAVSGSLRVLNIYRIAAEASTGARVDLTTLPLWIYGVPNADPPARPTITVKPSDMITNADTYEAEIEITLTPAATEAAIWRLRRSNLGATDALRMPIVTTGAMGAKEADGRQRGGYTDAGPVVISASAKLQPWVRYHWVAEAQGAPAPGSEAAGRPVPGLWSQPSDPTSLVLVPPQPPEAVTGIRLDSTPIGDGTFSGVTLKFSHPRALSGGVMGNYRVRIERRAPPVVDDDGLVIEAGPVVMLPEVPVTGAGPFKLSGMNASDSTDAPRTDTVYRLVVIDPLGREGAPAEATLS